MNNFLETRQVRPDSEDLPPRIVKECPATALGVLVVDGLSRYSTLSLDASTTTADASLVVAGACYLAAADRGDKRATGFLAEFRAAAGARLPRSQRWIL